MVAPVLAAALTGFASTTPTVIVVGSGLAGLSAAIEAYHAGANVTIIEKEPRTGGNSAKATSGINGAGTEAQRAEGIEDSAAELADDTLRSGHGLCDRRLVDMLATGSADAVEWLSREHGIALGRLSQCGGHSRPRTHRISPGPDGRAGPVGWTIVSALRKVVDGLEGSRMRVRTGCRLVELLQEERALPACASDEGTPVVGAVVGAVVEVTGEGGITSMEEMWADSVVLACGGYAYSGGKGEDSVLCEHALHACHYPTTNGPFATGDCTEIAQRAGASLVNMDKVQIHPTGFVDPKDRSAGTKFLAPEALRGSGGILVSHEGERFADELTTRDALTSAINSLGGSGAPAGEATAFLVLNEAAVDAFGADAVGFYVFKGLMREVEGAEGVASALPRASAEKVSATLAAYAESARRGRDEFGKSVFPTTFEAGEKLWLAEVTPSIHYTMGGVRINAAGEVLGETADETYKPIHGLFGAGLDADEWRPLTLRHREALSESVSVYSFNLARPWQRTGLGLGQYISVKASLNGEDHIRFYSPISRPDDAGHVDLLIKSDGRGCMSTHIDSLKPGDTLEFRGPMGGINLTHSSVRKIGLVAGGVGISPMLQILRHVLHQTRMGSGPTEVHLLYAANEERELVFREMLEAKAREYGNFTMTLALASPPDGWAGEVGFADGAMLQRTLFPPAEDVRVVLCGPPGMCRALKPQVAALGYSKDMFYSYM